MLDWTYCKYYESIFDNSLVIQTNWCVKGFTMCIAIQKYLHKNDAEP